MNPNRTQLDRIQKQISRLKLDYHSVTRGCCLICEFENGSFVLEAEDELGTVSAENSEGFIALLQQIDSDNTRDVILELVAEAVREAGSARAKFLALAGEGAEQFEAEMAAKNYLGEVTQSSNPIYAEMRFEFLIEEWTAIHSPERVAEREIEETLKRDTNNNDSERPRQRIRPTSNCGATIPYRSVEQFV